MVRRFSSEKSPAEPPVNDDEWWSPSALAVLRIEGAEEEAEADAADPDR